MKAVLKNHRQSPRKVRLVTDLIKGKGVEEALIILRYTNKRSTDSIGKLLSSAVSNAENNESKKRNNLYITNIEVNEGSTLKRWLPRARGRATPIRKRTSNISLTLAEKKEAVEKEEKKEKTTPKTSKTKAKA